jgi:hypothetical protein
MHACHAQVVIRTIAAIQSHKAMTTTAIPHVSLGFITKHLLISAEIYTPQGDPFWCETYRWIAVGDDALHLQARSATGATRHLPVLYTVPVLANVIRRHGPVSPHRLVDWHT